ncbi:prepilin-type N-terminal cleavage/methylation domain-containing protein [Sulfuricurvum sp.]|uniref:prepilin-type N-terminal cleavage/methylation domain-containing protein n=1 Tax=Sulfuricurvum sp. TaxID=2025608 RepID=UPI00260E8051|nr:prepilin-type N-terminal cleavage/methylation domain-containing protein [Sulfuricurvum sp.]MDD3597899.1 prepilin-type N-terminal cleavage/methylation domain-containing protein [Sulfuricurvum sp.]
MKYSKRAFTLIEMVIVIVIMGIIGKFGTDLLMNSYQNYIYGVATNRLLAQSEAGAEQIANRLQYRIKESVIVRNGGGFDSIATSTAAGNNMIVEWIGYDIDGWQGDAATTPTWSGIIDVDNAAATPIILISPMTSTARATAVINALSPRGLGINGAAIFFIGDESVSVAQGFGWNGAVGQSGNMHRIMAGGNVDEFAPQTGIFAGVDVYEYYRLAWTAYALVLNGNTLNLVYDYRPWLGETRANGTSVVLAENVNSFRMRSIGDVLKIQLCITDKGVFNVDTESKGYAVCKEKTIL